MKDIHVNRSHGLTDLILTEKTKNRIDGLIKVNNNKNINIKSSFENTVGTISTILLVV
jgi:hypothetical protein